MVFFNRRVAEGAEERGVFFGEIGRLRDWVGFFDGVVQAAVKAASPGGWRMSR